MSDKPKCAGTIRGGSWDTRRYPCRNAAKVQEPNEAGVVVGWCGRCAPSVMAVKDAKRTARWAAEDAEREARRAVEKAEARVLDAAAEWYRSGVEGALSVACLALEKAREKHAAAKAALS